MSTDGAPSPEPLEELEERLVALDEHPVESHPDTLEAVHRAVVAELDALSGMGAPERTSSGEDA